MVHMLGDEQKHLLTGVSPNLAASTTALPRRAAFDLRPLAAFAFKLSKIG